MTARGGQGEAEHATEQRIADATEDVLILHAPYSDNETSDYPYGAATGESASEYEDSRLQVTPGRVILVIREERTSIKRGN